MFNIGMGGFGNAMSKAASLRKPSPGAGSPDQAAPQMGRGMSSMFSPMPGMGGQSYAPSTMGQPGMQNQGPSPISFQSPMEGGGGGLMERLKQMMGGNTGVTGGAGMQSPGIMDYKNKILQGAGQQPMQSGFNFPMMRF